MTTVKLAEREPASMTGMLAPFVLRMGQGPSLTDDQLYELCRKNRDWQIERDADGDLLIMSPTGGETGKRNLELLILLGIWAKRDRTGVAFDSSPAPGPEDAARDEKLVVWEVAVRELVAGDWRPIPL